MWEDSYLLQQLQHSAMIANQCYTLCSVADSQLNVISKAITLLIEMVNISDVSLHEIRIELRGMRYLINLIVLIYFKFSA